MYDLYVYLFIIWFAFYFIFSLLLLSFLFTRSRASVRVISRTLNGIVDVDATSTCSILFFIIVFLSSFPLPLILFFFTFCVIQNNFYWDFFLFRFKVTLQLLIVFTHAFALCQRYLFYITQWGSVSSRHTGKNDVLPNEMEFGNLFNFEWLWRGHARARLQAHECAQ